jgi:hypothetical protein
MRYVDPDGRWHTDTRPEMLIREDGRVEWRCEHGIGHCVGHIRRWQRWMGIHGCDGDCAKFRYPEDSA